MFPYVLQHTLAGILKNIYSPLVPLEFLLTVVDIEHGRAVFIYMIMLAAWRPQQVQFSNENVVSSNGIFNATILG